MYANISRHLCAWQCFHDADKLECMRVYLKGIGKIKFECVFNKSRTWTSPRVRVSHKDHTCMPFEMSFVFHIFAGLQFLKRSLARFFYFILFEWIRLFCCFIVIVGFLWGFFFFFEWLFTFCVHLYVTNYLGSCNKINPNPMPKAQSTCRRRVWRLTFLTAHQFWL